MTITIAVSLIIGNRYLLNSKHEDQLLLQLLPFNHLLILKLFKTA
ncbi:hypothetical protein [Streptococcus equi]|nr:hypothetical protein [Streptococcus equi]